MTRNPKLRVNFDADMQYLLRLKHAVEEDEGYPREFRNELVDHIVRMQRVLMNAPVRMEEGVIVGARANGKGVKESVKDKRRRV